jgi:hypothetical protein
MHLECDDDVIGRVVPEDAKDHGIFIFRVGQSNSWTA